MREQSTRVLRRLLGRRVRPRLVTDGGQPADDPAAGEDAGGREDEQSEQEDEHAAERAAEREDEQPSEADDQGSEQSDEQGSEPADESTEAPDADGQGVDRANVEITEAGESEPAQPEWEEPDLDELPEFEIRADQPVASGGSGVGTGGAGAGESDAAGGGVFDGDAGDEAATPGDESDDPTAGRPNTARAPGASRVATEGTEAYIVAVELCARLPDDVRLPEEAADLVPAAVEAELEQDVQAYAAAEFDNERPTVDTLAFEEVDEEVWLRLRIGIPPESFAELDPDDIRTYALERLEGVF